MNRSLETIQGSSFSWLSLAKDINKAPLDLTDFDITGHIKNDFDDVDPVQSFTITKLNKTNVLAAIAAGTITLTTEEIAALVSDTYGKVYMLILLDDSITSIMDSATYVYSIRMVISAAYAETPYRGTFEVLPAALDQVSS